MDHLVMLILAGAACGAWVHAMRREKTPAWIKASGVPAILVIGGYFIIEALRTRGVWISGEAQAGLLPVISMGMGFSAATGALDERPKDEGECA